MVVVIIITIHSKQQLHPWQSNRRANSPNRNDVSCSIATSWVSAGTSVDSDCVHRLVFTYMMLTNGISPTHCYQPHPLLSAPPTTNVHTCTYMTSSNGNCPTHYRDGSRNIEGRGRQCAGRSERIYERYMHCQRQCVEAHSADHSTQSAENLFHLHFSVVWVGSCSTFVLCTALLTGGLSLSHVLERCIDTRPQTIKFVNSEL